MDRFNWDHDACVTCPVSGDVWEDVLRLVARWHMRIDLFAPRMERVCKRWKHFWQVAEGVFDVDVIRIRLPGMTLLRKPGDPFTRMSMKEVKQWRERHRLLQLVGKFQSRAVHTEQAQRNALARTQSIANFLASWRA